MNVKADVNTTSNILLLYLDMVYCQSPDLEIDSGLIALFDDSTPTGWTRFSALDSYSPGGTAAMGERVG
jgi:hypothetical protein